MMKVSSYPYLHLLSHLFYSALLIDDYVSFSSSTSTMSVKVNSESQAQFQVIVMNKIKKNMKSRRSP